MTDAESKPEPRHCSYCDRLPSEAEKKLKRCSRCHRAWYCGADCQRKHFSVHKKDCKRWSTQKKRSLEPKTAAKQTKFTVEEREGRGECLVVSPGSKFRKGERIRDDEHNRDLWEPLILPALHQDKRSSRCALCFGRLQESSYSFDLPPNPMYRLLFCSNQCREIASKYGLEKEERDCKAWVQNFGPGPSFIYPAAIILYRILVRECQGDPQIKINELQGTPRRDTSNNYDGDNPEHYGVRGVITIAMGMLQYSGMSTQYSPTMNYLVDMVKRIDVNGFTICEDESENLGVGLYGTPSFMNHSCRANTHQVFGFQRHNPPSLCLTAFSDIEPGQEICISYTDASCPSHIRRANLEKSYHFVCNCQACDINSEQQDDSTTMGLICCPDSKVIRADRGMSPSRPVYECTKCHRTDFKSALQELNAFEEKFADPGPQSAIYLQTTFQKLRKICYKSSWYVQEVGDQLMEKYLIRLALEGNDPVLEQQTALEAFKLAEEYLAASPVNGSTGAFSRHQMLRHRVAKLRLFLFPDPRRAIHELEEVLSSLEPYYPKDHTVIGEVKKSLASAMM